MAKSTGLNTIIFLIRCFASFLMIVAILSFFIEITLHPSLNYVHGLTIINETVVIVFIAILFFVISYGLDKSKRWGYWSMLTYCIYFFSVNLYLIVTTFNPSVNLYLIVTSVNPILIVNLIWTFFLARYLLKNRTIMQVKRKPSRMT